MIRQIRKPASVRAFAENIRDKDQNLSDGLIKDLKKNSFANLAKDRVDLLLGPDKVVQT